MTHTKGPWKVAYEPGKHIVVGCPERGICIVPNDDLEFEPVRLANAHLIAAAPEMLAVLEKLSSLLVDGEEYVPLELREELTTAIRKARR